MQICELNGLTQNGAAMLLTPCVKIPSWVRGLVDARPYADLDELLDRGRALSTQWTQEEVLIALSGHPRIGERTANALSTAEQSGVDPADTAIQARLRAGNERYEKRFGRIYLVRAAGRSAEELLALLEERLRNDDVTEMAVTKAQLAEITLLRLAGLFS